MHKQGQRYVVIVYDLMLRIASRIVESSHDHVSGNMYFLSFQTPRWDVAAFFVSE